MYSINYFVELLRRNKVKSETSRADLQVLSSTVEWLGLAGPESFRYLNQSQMYKAEGVDDVADFKELKVKSLSKLKVASEVSI